jgi:hypothetical protein
MECGVPVVDTGLEQDQEDRNSKKGLGLLIKYEE